MEYECKKCFGWVQNTGQPVGSMGGFEGGNELLTVLGLGQWTRTALWGRGGTRRKS